MNTLHDNLNAHRSAVAAALAQAEQADHTLALADGALSDVHDLLIDLLSVVTETGCLPASPAGDATRRSRVVPLVYEIDRVANATRSESLLPLRGGVISLSRQGGTPSFTIKPVMSDTLGSPEGWLSSLASGRVRDTRVAQRIVGGAVRQVTHIRAAVGRFQSEVVAPAIRAAHIAMENIDAAGFGADVPSTPEEIAGLHRSSMSGPLSSGLRAA